MDITVGPDQALWFSEFSAQQLGRISTIGNVFEVTTNPPTNSGPVGVAGGSDGNLWYTDYAAGRVGRLGLGAASGSIPWHPSYTVHPVAGLSVNVDLFDGHAQVRAAGMAVPGRGIAAALGRTWDSTLEQQGVVTPAGEGWVADTLVGMSTPGSLTGAVFYGDAGGAIWELTTWAPARRYRPDLHHLQHAAGAAVAADHQQRLDRRALHPDQHPERGHANLQCRRGAGRPGGQLRAGQQPGLRGRPGDEHRQRERAGP